LHQPLRLFRLPAQCKANVALEKVMSRTKVERFKIHGTFGDWVLTIRKRP